MKTLYIDLTDLIVHSLYHGVGTGVQRVQINVAYYLVKSISAQCFSIFGGHWENLDQLILESQGNTDKFLFSIRKKYSRVIKRLSHQKGSPLLSFPVRCIHKCVKSCRDLKTRFTVKFSSEDTILIMGAFWQYKPLVDFYTQKVKEGVSLIGILHDLIWLDYPEYVNKALFQKYLDLPFHLITVSNYTKQRLEEAVSKGVIGCNYLTLQSTSLAHEYVGVSRNSREAEPLPELKNVEYVLYVSSLEPHKNHSFLIAVWKELQNELGDELPKLVLAGKRARSADDVLKSGNLGNKIVFLETPDNERLKSLYENCIFTVFPSLTEGWGLPVGESLWFGKTCAASNRASIPEVGGDLCIYFDPAQSEDMKKAIRSLLDPKLRMQHEEKIQLAHLRTWEDVAYEIKVKVISIVNVEAKAA